MTALAIGMGIFAGVFFFAGLAVISCYVSIAQNGSSELWGNRNWQSYILSPERIYRATKPKPDDDPYTDRMRKKLRRYSVVQMVAVLGFAVLGTIMTTILK